MRTRIALALAVLAVLAVSAGGGASAAPSATSTATITVTFSDHCRDFTAVSSKDISNIQLVYASGETVKIEGITTPTYSVDGNPGDELTAVIVKSGTTSQQFDCVPDDHDGDDDDHH